MSGVRYPRQSRVAETCAQSFLALPTSQDPQAQKRPAQLIVFVPPVACRHSSRCQRPKIQITISNMSIKERKSSSAVIASALSRYSLRLSCGLGLAKITPPSCLRTELTTSSAKKRCIVGGNETHHFGEKSLQIPFGSELSYLLNNSTQRFPILRNYFACSRRAT